MSRRNKELAEIFEKMADILEFLGDSPYRISTYRRAATVISELQEDVEEAFKSGRLERFPGIGSSTLLKVEEFLKTGTVKKYEDLRKKVPEDLLELMDVPGIGPKTLKVAYEKLGVKSKDDFIRALRNGSLEKLPGFGRKKVEKILKGIKLWERSRERISLIDAYQMAQEVLEYVKGIGGVIEAQVAGSIRRMRETVGDIDILVSATKESWSGIHEGFVRYPGVKEVLAKGETKSSVVLKEGRQVDLRTVEPSQWGAALQYFTGSKRHNIRVRDIAKEKGLKVNEYGVFKTDTGERVAGETEEEVYRAVGMQWVPPEIREDWGEVELALENKLPRLVSLEDIKGDFHMHTNWSDGINSVEEMAGACYELGYEYIVIGDHSQSARVANGLTPERYVEQWKVIEEVNKAYEGKNFRILKGAEVDILPDGSLDLPDEVLERFDFVVASIHSRFDRDNTDRILKAMENPFVNLIGHPTGKSYGYREGYPLDMDRVLEKAKETGTALEVNTFRIDIAPELIRRCMQGGVTVAIVTDAHAVAHLPYMKLGVGIARRGWATPDKVLNCRSLEGILEFVSSKRKAMRVG